MRSGRTLWLALGLLVVAGCGDKPSPPAPAGGGGTPPAPTPSSPGSPAASADHGASVDLGTVTLAGHAFHVMRLGDIVPGKEGAFEVDLASGPTGASLAKLNVYAWVEDEAGKQLSAPSKGDMEGKHLHFHVTPRADAGVPHRLVLRLRADGGVDERGGLPLDGHGHEHAHAPHDGVPAVFKVAGGAEAGHLELKLHDDKGDLELWLAADKDHAKPFDLPLDTVVTVEFVDVGGRKVAMKVRNAATNEDEDGKANVRDGKTNYFVWPGASGEDAAWLVGPSFSSVVKVTFSAAGTRYESEEFMLTPHTHADGETHD